MLGGVEQAVAQREVERDEGRVGGHRVARGDLDRLGHPQAIQFGDLAVLVDGRQPGRQAQVEAVHLLVHEAFGDVAGQLDHAARHGLAHQLRRQAGFFEAFAFEVERTSGAITRLSNFYTIHEERLAALGADALHGLHRAGHLQAAYMAIASLSQFRALIERQNQFDSDQA